VFIIDLYVTQQQESKPFTRQLIRRFVLLGFKPDTGLGKPLKRVGVCSTFFFFFCHFFFSLWNIVNTMKVSGVQSCVVYGPKKCLMFGKTYIETTFSQVKENRHFIVRFCLHFSLIQVIF